MPEVQQTQQSGEMTQRFIAFLMRQAQTIALFLGQIPNPQSGKPEPHLDMAKLLIDELEMLREKTRNNRSSEETEILNGMLSDFQMAYVRAVEAAKKGPAPEPAASAGEAEKPVPPAPAEEQPMPEPPVDKSAPGEEKAETKKRFTKSYG